MANSFIKAEAVVGQMLGVLDRDTVALQFVWRDLPEGEFRGAKNDTVSLRVPAYMNARTRTMRANTTLTVDELDETKVDVTLDTHVYKAVKIRDEELTLDITDFGAQVTEPAMGSVVRGVDDTIFAAMEAATYEVEVDLDEDDPYLGIVDGRIALNNHSVPASQRWLACGSDVEAAILKSDRLARYDASGSSEVLREAIIGRIGGFTAVSAPGLDPATAIAAHKTAFAVGLVAPVVPEGAAWGERRTYRDMSLRVLKDYMPDATNGPVDRLLTDTFMGIDAVKDRGTVDDDGKFVPSEDGTDDPILVRAVKLALPGSA